MGANKVYSVELRGDYESIHKNHIVVNGFPEERFKFIDGDITKSEAVIERLDQPIDIVVANIGPTYGEAHLAAIRLLRYLPTVKTFIGGSYVAGHPEMGSKEAIQLLAEYGYSSNFRELRLRRRIQAFVVDKDPT